MPEYIKRPSGRFLHQLRAHLRQGGLIAYPTEGSYGLGCLPQHVRALRRLMAIKKRPQHKGLIVVGADLTQLQPLLADVSVHTQNQLQVLWPAAKTLLLPAHARVPILLRGRGRQTVAVRVPDFAPTRFLCRAVGSALVSTSCNRAGKKVVTLSRQVQRQFGRQLLFIGGRTGERRQPSQIIDWASGQRLR